MDSLIHLCIPVQRHTQQLDVCLSSIERYTNQPHLVHIFEEPNLNVSECRSLAISSLRGKAKYLCFLDDDTLLVEPDWLSTMLGTIKKLPDAGAVFLKEWWGTEPRGCGHMDGITTTSLVPYGPSACMLIDLDRVPEICEWDKYIGLRSGWLGGDFEEVAWQLNIERQTRLRFYVDPTKMYNHLGGKTTRKDFIKTDRLKSVRAMMILIGIKYRNAPNDDDFFKDIQYLPARDDDDCYLNHGTIIDCYKGVIKRNGLSKNRNVRKHILGDMI